MDLTEVGQRLYQHGRVIRDEVLAARESVASLGKGLHGSVRLSLPTGFGHLVSVGLVPDYVVRQDVAEGRVVTSLDAWRLSVFGTRLFLVRMPNQYQSLATRTLIDFVVAKARSWAG